MDTLREELIEAQKARSDLLKWKLLIVAGIGGASLGFSGSGSLGSNSYLALAVIPVACAYVDLLCRHLSLRNKAIGLFCGGPAHADGPVREYERFYAKVASKAWGNSSLEAAAMRGCTIALSLAVVPLGIGMAPRPEGTPSVLVCVLFASSGLFGVLFSVWLQRYYRRAIRKATALFDELYLVPIQAGPYRPTTQTVSRPPAVSRTPVQPSERGSLTRPVTAEPPRG